MAYIKKIDEMQSLYERDEYCIYEFASIEFITKGRLNREIRSHGVVRKPKFMKSFDTFKEANDYATKMLDEVYGTDVYYSMYLFGEIEEEYAHLNYREVIKEFTFFDPATLDIVENEYMMYYAKKSLNERWDMAYEMGYEPKTTFWDDFTIADKFGVKAIKDTFNRAFAEWKDDYIYLTELVLVLNHKIWQWYEKNRRVAEVYNDIWKQADQYAVDNLKGKELDYFYRTTD